MDAGTKIMEKGWNVDDLIAHVQKHGAEIGKDNDGQIVIYTDLFQHTDGALYSDPS